jgi:hypothetical protein
LDHPGNCKAMLTPFQHRETIGRAPVWRERPHAASWPALPARIPAVKRCTWAAALGVHSRYGLHTRAVTVYRDPLTEGFSHFVTSMTAPVASGWSGCRVGLAPTGKRRLSTAHATNGLSRLRNCCPVR